MRAVNLIPADSRRRASGGSPGLAVVAGLLVLLAGVTAYVVTANQVTDRRAELARVQARATSVNRALDQLRPYQQFAELSANRVETVRSLARSRFDWDRTMRDLSHVTTPQVWLTSVTGTVNPDVTLDTGGAAGTSDFRSALPAPALQISGCAVSNVALVGFLSRLRAMHGATRVTLADAEKSENAATPTGSGSSGGSTATSGCDGSDGWPQFHVDVFFNPPAEATTPAAPGTPSTANASSTTTPAAGGSTP